MIRELLHASIFPSNPFLRLDQRPFILMLHRI